MDDGIKTEAKITGEGGSLLTGRRPEWGKLKDKGLGDVKEIHVTLSFTKNMGNYQSMKAEAGMTCGIDNPEKVDGIFKGMWRECAMQIQQTITEAVSGIK